MRSRSASKRHTGNPLLFLATFVLLAQPSRNAVAENLLGLYVGGAIGQSRVEARGQTIYSLGDFYSATGSFRENHAAFKVLLGIRPISLLGAEVSYTDFGHSSGGFNAYPANASMKGVSAFGVLYLPVPIVDVFLKAGVARIQSELNGTGIGGPNCTAACPAYLFLESFQLDRTNVGGAGGVGAQYKLGSFAPRVEYERFDAAGGTPSLLSAGITWSFL
jgi:Outer membrane protein beta-barrel domain